MLRHDNIKFLTGSKTWLGIPNDWSFGQGWIKAVN